MTWKSRRFQGPRRKTRSRTPGRPSDAENDAILEVQRALRDPGVNQEVHALRKASNPSYRYSYNPDNPLEGHCAVAAEAVYHLLGGKKAGYTPVVAKDMFDSTHWWIRSPSGAILDPTAEQYLLVGEQPPYSGGHGCGFQSPVKDPRTGMQRPSRPAQAVLDRVGKS